MFKFILYAKITVYQQNAIFHSFVCIAQLTPTLWRKHVPSRYFLALLAIQSRSAHEGVPHFVMYLVPFYMCTHAQAWKKNSSFFILDIVVFILQVRFGLFLYFPFFRLTFEYLGYSYNNCFKSLSANLNSFISSESLSSALLISLLFIIFSCFFIFLVIFLSLFA